MVLKGKKGLSEFIGTFYFILTISLSASLAGAYAPLAIGFMLMAQVFAFGYISGGHFNPAVTLGVLLIGQVKARRAGFYVLAQLLGGILAAVISWVLIDETHSGFKTTNAPKPLNDILTSSVTSMTIFRALLAEFIFTSALVSVVLHVACSRQRDNHHYGLAIGMTVLASAYSVGGISGGAFNPAVATALHFQRLFMGDTAQIQYLWIYWVGDLLGACAAAGLFSIVTAMEDTEAIYLREEKSDHTQDHDLKEIKNTL
jgi:glycerol uptake facilitator-like aquaporin